MIDIVIKFGMYRHPEIIICDFWKIKLFLSKGFPLGIYTFTGCLFLDYDGILYRSAKIYTPKQVLSLILINYRIKYYPDVLWVK